MAQAFALESPVNVPTASTWRVDVSPLRSDPLTPPPDLEETALYFVQGVLNETSVRVLTASLLADPITDQFTISRAGEAPPETRPFVEVTLLPGVTDAAADNLLRAAQRLSISGIERAATGQRYVLNKTVEPGDLSKLAADRLYNAVIQRAWVNEPAVPPFVDTPVAGMQVEQIALRQVSDARLGEISRERRLALDLAEMRAVQRYYRAEGREPTDVELEMIAQTWSEHCVHKTFRALIRYDDGSGVREIDGLLRSTIRAATEALNRPWVRSAFVDNAGIIAFDETFDLAFKVETHNHPSALEPFGGANTGVGGVIRDVLGVSAKPIANTDVLCFGPPDLPAEALSEGVLHPRRIADGVIHGVEDYGNKMGIPTVNGSVWYHDGYTANPLVFCGCLGLLPHGSHVTGAKPGDLIVVLGGFTGRDGLRGATFSSMEMDISTGDIAGSSVQIGNPIMEKQVQEVILRLRDASLYHAITDCGAGGLSSAVGEMAAETGAVVHLERVPLKYAGLQPWEIWLSEAQERMVIAIAPEAWPVVRDIAAGQDVTAASIGHFTDDGQIRLLMHGQSVGRLSNELLQKGMPRRQLEAVWAGPVIEAGSDRSQMPVRDVLPALLGHLNIRSREPVVRRYDHLVQGGTHLGPYHGVSGHAPQDAAVLVPAGTQAADNRRGVVLSAGINPLIGEIDPYSMAWAAVDEAVRAAVACGADPDHIAILDNFCWGNPTLPDRLGGLVRCALGCHDAALTYQTPFISGKDSLNNEYTGADGQKHAIPGTLLISAVGITPDVTLAPGTALRPVASNLYVVGETQPTFGASHYAQIAGFASSDVAQPTRDPLPTLHAMYEALRGRLLLACHDISEGGMAVAAAEMCIGGESGARIVVDPDAAEMLLFSESLTRWVVQVDLAHDDAFRSHFEARGIPVTAIGTARPTDERVSIETGREIFECTIDDLKRWSGVPVATPVTVESVSDWQRASVPTLHSKPRVLILHANGTNRDHDAALACTVAGGEPEIVHVNQLAHGMRRLSDYDMIVVPGGFSYGDDLGAGVLWAQDLRLRFGAELQDFVDSGRPVLGICNGFQALVKAGLLPDADVNIAPEQRTSTLTFNAHRQFECRWVVLEPQENSVCLFTRGLVDPILAPVAHGEGRFLTAASATVDALRAAGMIALRYSADNYPHNPNGSAARIAGICNRAGNVLGLMPHPENHIFDWQHPGFGGDRFRRGGGLALFTNALRYIASRA